MLRNQPSYGGMRSNVSPARTASGDMQKQLPPFSICVCNESASAQLTSRIASKVAALQRLFCPEKRAYLLLKNHHMRDIKLSGREAAVVRAIGFAESMLGAEILDSTRMEPEDVGDTLNGLIAAGFIETIPYAEQVDLAEMPTTAFEVNPAYVHELRVAISRR
jgi:hypothetical protein